MAVYLTT